MENYVAELFVSELLVRGAVLCLLTAFALGLFRPVAAAYRHLLCVLALFSLFILPFAQRRLPPLPLLPTQNTATFKQATVSQPEAPHPADLPSKSELPSPRDKSLEPKAGAMPATLIPAENVHATRAITAIAPTPEQTHTRRVASFLFAVWSIGASALLIRLMVALLRLRRLAADSRKAVLGSVPIRISERVHTPLTWGIRRSVILLPSALFAGDPAICKTALCHEQAHIARWDWAWNLFAEIVCACCWFQPGAWWLRRQLRLESERACDDRVLLSGIDGPDYAAHLLHILRTVCTNEIAPAMAQCRGMEERMTHILDTAKPRRAQTAWMAVSALFALALLSLAALRVSARPAEENQDRTLTGHSKPVTVVAFSPDSKRLVTGSADGTAIVWDVTTGQKLLALTGNTAALSKVVYTPDGKNLITGGSDGMAYLWDGATGKLLRTLPGSGGGVCALDISADGVNLLVGYDSGKVKIWNTDSGKDIVTFVYDNRLLAAAISPDGKSVAAGYLDSTLKVWDMQTQSVLLSKKTSTSDGITAAHFDIQNGLYTWGHEEAKEGLPKVAAMRMWRIGSIKQGGSDLLGIVTFPGTENTVSHAVDYNTFTMINGLSEGHAILNNMRDAPVTLDAHDGPVSALAISPDGVFAATGGQRNGKGEAKLWVIKAHRTSTPKTTNLEAGKSAATSNPGAASLQTISAHPADTPATINAAIAPQADSNLAINLKRVAWGKAVDGLEAGILLNTPASPGNKRIAFNSTVHYEVLIRNATRQERFIEVQCQNFTELDPFLIPDGDIHNALNSGEISAKYRSKGLYDEREAYLGYVVKLVPGEAVVVPDGDTHNVLGLYIGNADKQSYPRIEEVTKGLRWLIQPITVRSLTSDEAAQDAAGRQQVNLTSINSNGTPGIRMATRRSISPGNRTLYAKAQINLLSSQ